MFLIVLISVQTVVRAEHRIVISVCSSSSSLAVPLQRSRSNKYFVAYLWSVDSGLDIVYGVFDVALSQKASLFISALPGLERASPRSSCHVTCQ